MTPEEHQAKAERITRSLSKCRAVDYEIVIDRREAIRRALGVAEPGDVVLLAGKGHERSMITAAGKEPWDERSEAEAALRELGYGSASG